MESILELHRTSFVVNFVIFFGAALSKGRLHYRLFIKSNHKILWLKQTNHTKKINFSFFIKARISLC